MILITGATSFVGRAVVRRAAAEQREIRCLLCPSRHELQLPAGVSFSSISASMNDLPALRTAMQDVTAIVHLLGEEEITHGEIPASYIEDTANLISAARETGITRFICLSRLGADRASAYPLMRVMGELEATVLQAELNYTILQTSIVYGAEDQFTNVLTMLAKSIPIVMPIPDAGLSRFQPLWVEDLARCILTTTEQNKLVRRTIPLGGPEHFTLEQMVTNVLTAAGIHKRLLTLRIPMMHWAIALADALLPRNPTPFWWIDLLTAGSATDLMSIPQHYDFEPCRFADCLSYLSRKRPWRRDLVRLVFNRL